VGDLNGDGKIEVVTATEKEVTTWEYSPIKGKKTAKK
jgi:hypothetical protein